MILNFEIGQERKNLQLFTFGVHFYGSHLISDRKPGVGFPGAPGGPDPGAGVGPGDCTSQKPGAGGFLLSKPRGFRGVF